MRQWDILLFPFREELPHPAVVISNDERCENADFDVVNRADLHDGAVESSSEEERDHAFAGAKVVPRPVATRASQPS